MHLGDRDESDGQNDIPRMTRSLSWIPVLLGFTRVSKNCSTRPALCNGGQRRDGPIAVLRLSGSVFGPIYPYAKSPAGGLYCPKF